MKISKLWKKINRMLNDIGFPEFKQSYEIRVNFGDKDRSDPHKVITIWGTEDEALEEALSQARRIHGIDHVMTNVFAYGKSQVSFVDGGAGDCWAAKVGGYK